MNQEYLITCSYKGTIVIQVNINHHSFAGQPLDSYLLYLN